MNDLHMAAGQPFDWQNAGRSVVAQCFVMMPFRTACERIYRKAIVPALDYYAVAHSRADQIRKAGVISDQIIEHIRCSHFCIADLSGANRNVITEVGMAIAAGKPLIMLSRDNLDELHFDISHLRVFPYKSSDSGIDELCCVLRDAIGATLTGPSARDDTMGGHRLFVTTPLSGCGTQEQYGAFMGRIEPIISQVRAIPSVASVYYFNERFRTIQAFKKGRWTVPGYLQEINSADLFVLIVETGSVSGVYFEAGYALARGIPSIYFVSPTGRIPQLMQRCCLELPGLVSVEHIEAIEEIPSRFERIISGSQSVRR